MLILSIEPFAGARPWPEAGSGLTFGSLNPNLPEICDFRFRLRVATD